MQDRTIAECAVLARYREARGVTPAGLAAIAAERLPPLTLTTGPEGGRGVLWPIAGADELADRYGANPGRLMEVFG